jgi:adhesin transport system outer membrane protein
VALQLAQALQPTPARVAASAAPPPAGPHVLAALVREALAADPGVLEALANEEAAAERTRATRAQHEPVFGARVTSNLASSANTGTPFRGLTGRINLYSAGAIDAQVKRDEYKQAYQRYKTADVRETVAYNVAQHYLDALRAKELLAVEVANLRQHQRIIGDLEVVVAYDVGRRFELVQAQSRALQVQQRTQLHERNMRLALARLSRYVREVPALVDPLPAAWRNALPSIGGDLREHPLLQAQQAELQALRAEELQLQRSRLPRVDLEGGLGNYKYAQLVLNWPFFDRGANANIAAVARQIEASRQRSEQTEQEIRQRIATAETDMQRSRALAEAAESQIAASRQVVELYEMQFKVGRRPMLDLLNAYAELASTEVAAATARADYRQAVFNLLYARSALIDWLAQQP